MVNKADNGNEMRAELVSRELQSSFHLSSNPEQPKVLACSGRDGKNIPELFQAIRQCGWQSNQEVSSKINKECKKDVATDFSQSSFTVKRVNHLGIVPKDLSQAKVFFGSLLGLDNQGSETVPEQKVKVEFYAIEGATNQDQAIEIVTKRFKEELNGVTQ